MYFKVIELLIQKLYPEEGLNLGLKVYVIAYPPLYSYYYGLTMATYARTKQERKNPK